MNWVWYSNYPEGSEQFDRLMTDIHGHKHRYTVPVGSVREDNWVTQKDYANMVLPPQFAELVNKTTRPFVQAVTDVISTHATFFDGKVLLVGDALCGVRPHTAGSVNQAALHANLLGQVFKGEMTLQDWEKQVLEHARIIGKRGIEMGAKLGGQSNAPILQTAAVPPSGGYNTVKSTLENQH
jgi:flavin-dependent dehydrogenase